MGFLARRNRKVYGASRQIVREFDTDTQARNWVDSEVKLSEKRIEENDLVAWYTGDGTWTIAEDGGSWAIGSIQIETNRERVEDLSGLKKFRVCTSSQVKVSLRVTIKGRLILSETYLIRKGHIATLREAMKLFDAFRSDARRQLEVMARDAGIPEYQIIGCFDCDTKRHLINLWQLVN